SVSDCFGGAKGYEAPSRDGDVAADAGERFFAEIAEPQGFRLGVRPNEFRLTVLAGRAEESDDPGFAVIAGFQRGDEDVGGLDAYKRRTRRIGSRVRRDARCD